MSNVLMEDTKKEFHKLLSGPRESREILYQFYEEKEMREALKGEFGVIIYLEILSIAEKAGAPLEEVRNYFIPLLDQERFNAYVKKVVSDAVDNGTFEKALELKLDKLKDEAEKKRLAHEELIALRPKIIAALEAPMRTLKNEKRGTFLKALDTADGRERLYQFLEKKHMRAIFKSADGMAVYQEILELAQEVEAPLDEVRSRIFPLLDHDKIDALLLAKPEPVNKKGWMKRLFS